MRSIFAAAVAVAGLAVLPSSAHAQVSLDGFGSLPINELSSLGDSGFPLDFGGRVSFNLAPGIQASGEFGRLGNVLPSVVALPLSFVPGDLRASAFYGEGGIRAFASPHSAVSPYVEGSVGIAHLQFDIGGLGSTANAIARTALNLVDSRDPIVGAGGGVILRSGPIHVDVGYRYKRILTNSVLSSVLSAGQQLDTHQMRFGVGVSF